MTVSQKKWYTLKVIIELIVVQFIKSDEGPETDLKYFGENVGFLFHLYMSYTLITPFLKGVYLAMNSWNKVRDNNGWKMLKRAYEYFLNYLQRSGRVYGKDVFAEDNDLSPLFVTAMHHLYVHIRFLLEMF